jgi:hypothetical protein
MAKGLNMPISLVPIAGGTTEPIKELARNPDLLAHTRVVVWIIANDAFTDVWPALHKLPVQTTSSGPRYTGQIRESSGMRTL